MSNRSVMFLFFVCKFSITINTVSTTTTTTTTTLPTTDPCQDKIANCKNFEANTCTSISYSKWAHENCPRYCGFCTPLFTTPEPPCQDKINNCQDYSPSVCQSYGPWSMVRCRRYCGHCQTDADKGFHNSCHYKGKTYNTGDTWTDGCDYTCQCIDGQTGTYKCRNQCPIYYNLPSECILVPDYKSCCKKPVCNFKNTQNSFIDRQKGQKSDGSAGCLYKQRTYGQDETWTDGMDYNCRCIDATSGEYRCVEICATYSSLPNECTLVTNSLGCQEPRCFFEKMTGNFTGYGSISGRGLSKSKPTPPPCTDKISNCAEYGRSTCKTYEPWARDRCLKYCNFCDVPPPPADSDRCVYKGQAYRHGESWNISCGVECVCEDASHGYYRCTDKCAKFYNIPARCQAIKVPGNCCESIQCAFGSLQTSARNPNSIGGNANNSLVVIYTQSTIPTASTTARPHLTPDITGCMDHLSATSCADHQREYRVCDRPIYYLEWVRAHCAKSCGLCASTQAPSVNCVDSTIVKCSNTNVCSDTTLRSFCPVTCGLCVPCKDSSLINCSDNRVCSDARLRHYCPKSCGLCGKKTAEASSQSPGTSNIFGK